jgi:hypothetical protein
MCGLAVERLPPTRRYCATPCRMRAYRLRRNGRPLSSGNIIGQGDVTRFWALDVPTSEP